MNPSTTKHAVLALTLFILALLLRVWGIGDFRGLQGDDREFVPKAKLYMDRGQFANALWYHPPLGSVFLYGSIKLFGDNVYGWRMKNVVLGALSVLLVYLIGWELFGRQDAAFLAALMLLFDPLHLLLSRTTFEEVQAVALFLAALYSVLRYLHGTMFAAPVAGVFFGLSIATKWYFAPAMCASVLVIFAVKWLQGDRSFSGAAYLLSSLVLLPTTVYILAFLPWFGRGYDLGELMTIHVHAWSRSHTLYLERFSRFLTEGFVPPSGWFIRPALTGFRIGIEERVAQYIVFMNNVPWAVMTLPALAVLAHRAYRNRGPLSVYLLIALFVCTYVPFLLAHRPILLYSALSLAPLSALAIAGAYVQTTNGAGHRGWFIGGAATAVAAVGLYLYPLVSMKHVPEALYRPLFLLGHITFIPFQGGP